MDAKRFYVNLRNRWQDSSEDVISYRRESVAPHLGRTGAVSSPSREFTFSAAEGAQTHELTRAMQLQYAPCTAFFTVCVISVQADVRGNRIVLASTIVHDSTPAVWGGCARCANG